MYILFFKEKYSTSWEKKVIGSEESRGGVTVCASYRSSFTLITTT